ncbi:outer membrane beta-barrel protein [Helicobacter jaachi]|uniref:Outer membrane beta-barrel protein n=1 Tax=Helicobacter jaachi TaxID=1677920 RepID=A0A4U8T7Y5_9HELI|nr:outer membrane beta-barrel protein [Helicobacter jaachi]TLD95759.1 outer membrane beta-barrel protein [Helicobacter jaachi]
MKRYLFMLFMAICVAYAGESGGFIGGSLSLNNTHYSGTYSAVSNGIITQYPHSNDSSDKFGLSVRFGYQKFSADSRFGGRFYVEYNNNGYAAYRDEGGKAHKMDAYALGLNADVLFELVSLNGVVLGIFAGGGVVFDNHKFTNAQYAIYQENPYVNRGATLSGYGLAYQGGVSLSFAGKHRLEFEIKRSGVVSDYDSGFIYVGANAERLELEARGFLSYRVNYAYVF